MMKPLFILGAAAFAAARYTGLTHEADTVANEPSVVEMLSTKAPFDGPKVIPVNASTFDWWYFDVVSEDASQSLTVNFYSAPHSALGFGAELDSINYVHVSGVFPNGTMFNSAVVAEDSYVRTVGDGSSGSWVGSGFSWSGSEDLLEYRIKAKDTGSGFSGSMSLRSVAPAHYPCGPPIKGQSEEVVPGVGWANSMPDAEGKVKFKIGDDVMSFTGYGYHDKNWGSRSFPESVGSWYWGHARLGEYSIVWFDTLDTEATEYVSAYVSKAGEVLTRQCSGLKIRPYGDNSTYPPVVSTGSPTGYHLEIDLPVEGKLLVNVTNGALVTTLGNPYQRFIGPVTGTLAGQALPAGSGLWEQFKLKESW
ncbi:hypothetical protein N7453_000265 [Penicillium expansum]|nr:hypothetical protein N7453_000265 [Penicillium expansum]